MKTKFTFGRVSVSSLEKVYGKDFMNNKLIQPYLKTHLVGTPPHNMIGVYTRKKGFVGIDSSGETFFHKEPVFNRGGAVHCVITLKNGDTVYGESYCSFTDNFCYEEGKKEAFKDALSKL